MKNRGFVYIFVLSAILALSLICVQTMELFSVELRAAAGKRTAIKELYLLETGISAGKALVLTHASTLGFEKTFYPEPELKITITDESAKLSPFFLKTQDTDKYQACTQIFENLTKDTDLTKQLTQLTTKHKAINSRRHKSKQSVLFPGNLNKLIKSEHIQFFTVIKTRGININTAPRPVLNAVFKNKLHTKTILNARKHAPIRNREELKKILSTNQLPQTVKAQITFDSRFYKIRVRVQKENSRAKEIELLIELNQAEKEKGVLVKELLCEEIKALKP